MLHLDMGSNIRFSRSPAIVKRGHCPQSGAPEAFQGSLCSTTHDTLCTLRLYHHKLVPKVVTPNQYSIISRRLILELEAVHLAEADGLKHMNDLVAALGTGTYSCR